MQKQGEANHNFSMITSHFTSILIKQFENANTINSSYVIIKVMPLPVRTEDETMYRSIPLTS